MWTWPKYSETVLESLLKAYMESKTQYQEASVRYSIRSTNMKRITAFFIEF